MTALPGVPGIIEGTMTITPEPDGRMSFRVLIGKQTDRCDRIELIISPEHVRQALAGTKIRRLTDTRVTDEMPMFPCHIGFSHNKANPAP